MSHYEFADRIPVDHVLHLIRVVRLNMSDLLSVKGDILEEVGAITGELGAWFNAQDVPIGDRSVTIEQKTIEELCEAIEQELAPDEAISATIDFNTIMMIVRLIIELLQRI